MVMVAILTTVYLLMPYQPEPAANYKRIVTSGADLDGRMLQSHGIYDRLLEARKGLIKKFGPNPSDIALYVVYLYPRRSGFTEISFFFITGSRPTRLPGRLILSVRRLEARFR
jgi:hypothetical protein